MDKKHFKLSAEDVALEKSNTIEDLLETYVLFRGYKKPSKNDLSSTKIGKSEIVKEYLNDNFWLGVDFLNELLKAMEIRIINNESSKLIMENHLNGSLYTVEDYEDIDFYTETCESCGDSDIFLGEYDNHLDFMRCYAYDDGSYEYDEMEVLKLFIEEGNE